MSKWFYSAAPHQNSSTLRIWPESCESFITASKTISQSQCDTGLMGPRGKRWSGWNSILYWGSSQANACGEVRETKDTFLECPSHPEGFDMSMTWSVPSVKSPVDSQGRLQRKLRNVSSYILQMFFHLSNNARNLCLCTYVCAGAFW